MWDMAGSTVPLRNRRVLCLCALLPLNRVSMTRAANTDKRRLQKAALSGCVGTMAAQASLLAHNRPVHPVLAVYIIHCIAVTAPA